MYDVSDDNSFKGLRNWIQQIEANSRTKISKVLVGNNCDNPNRVVTEEQGKKLAEDFNMAFFEASPKSNQNINEIFYYIAEEIFKLQENNNPIK